MFRTCSNSNIYIPVREYRSVEKNVLHQSLHAVGMQPMPAPLDAFHTECRILINQFSTERYIPTECYTTNGNLNSLIYK